MKILTTGMTIKTKSKRYRTAILEDGGLYFRIFALVFGETDKDSQDRAKIIISNVDVFKTMGLL